MAKPPLRLDVRGRTGLHYYSGLIYEELHPQLRGQQAVRTFMEMRDNDAVIGAFLFVIDMLIRQVEWTEEPFSNDTSDVENAEFLRTCREDMSHTWEDFISEVLSMLPFGWSYFETVYKRRLGDSPDPTKRSRYNDGKIGWRKIEIRSQESLDEWEFGEDGSLRGMWQRPAPTFERLFIPIEKSLHFRTKAIKNNPEARSILRNAYRSWRFLKRLQEIEAIGVERDLAGLPVMEVPPEVMMPNASSELQTLRSNLETMISEIRRDEREGVLVPAERVSDGAGGELITGYKLRAFQSGGNRAHDTDKIIRRYESRIAASVMAEFILLGTDKVGSFALADNKTNLFAVAIGAWVRNISAVLNRYAIPRLFALNGLPTDRLPLLVPGDIERPALEGITKFVAELTKAGILHPDDTLERELRRMAHLPAPDDTGDVL